MQRTYPLSLVLAKTAVLVVGGGEVATRKIKGLQECGAFVTIVSPVLALELKQMVDQGLCQWIDRAYGSADLEGIELVFACTDEEAVNEQVAKDARERHLLINVADRPELCSFYLPSVLRRENLSIAVSTEGSSPMAARLIREDLEEQFGVETNEFLSLLQGWREKANAGLSAEKRQLFWSRVGEIKPYGLVKQGQLNQVEEMLTALFNDLRL